MGYAYNKGVLKNGRAFVVEDYAGRNVELNFLFDAMFRGVQQLFQTQFGETMVVGVRGGGSPTPPEDLDLAAFGPNPAGQPPDPPAGPSLASPDGKIEMQFASEADSEKVKALLSFDFETVAGPVEPFPYRPIQASGPDGKPHYGIGGFHHFEPLDATPSAERLSAPAQISFSYEDDEVDALEEATVGAYKWSPSRLDWDLVPGALDPVNNTFRASVSELGTYTLAPTMPAGFIQWTLVSVERSGSDLSAKTRVRVRSSVLRNNAGGPARPGELLHVFASLPGVFTNTGPEPIGAVISPDADPNTSGVQVATGADGTVEVEFELPGAPPVIQVNGFSDRGTATSQFPVVLVVP